MGWGSTARQAAAAEYGRQNWRRFAARRRTAAVAVSVAVAALLVGRWVAVAWRPSWTVPAVFAAVAVVVLVFVGAVAVRTRRW